jgi:multicomponent Na+:H+ antiporter subunit D
MNWSFWLPLLVIGTSLVTGFVIFLLREEQFVVSTTMNIAGAMLKLFLVGVIVWLHFLGYDIETRIAFMPGIDFAFKVDFLAIIFMALSAMLWLLTTIYAIGYLENSPHRSRFFGFFSLCVMATMGIALAGNLVTFFVFYETLTIVTYPLVVHRGTRAALAAGRTYLLYTLAGGVFLLGAIAWLHAAGGSLDFQHGGGVEHLTATHPTQIILIFGLMIAGLGVKAALVPFHGWLPEAMIAPAPVSALLHAVAVVKAGAFGIVRVVYDVFGLSVAAELGGLVLLAALAGFTILYGSMRALKESDIKKRLAWSTVSQLSYITLGVALVSPLATIGGLVHLMHQGLMKITLFLCAGLLAETIEIKKVDELSGVGRRMPWTMVAFTVAAFGMIGVPPTAGFISKWYLGLGAVEAGAPWVLAVLAGSSILNAMYFLPLIGRAWFGEPRPEWREPHSLRRLEAHWMLLLPAIVTAILSLAAGLFAGTQFSPLGLARWAATELEIAIR